MAEKTLHSPIGASSYARVKACPASVRLSEGITKASSKYAEEGTEAHEVAAHYLESTFNGIPLKVFDNEEMVECATEYADLIVEDAQGDCELRIEHAFDLSEIHPGLYGTADAVLYTKEDNLLRVYDYKYGKGIPVDVVDAYGNPNSQLTYYALGALYTSKYKVDEVELVIVQPRCEHPDGKVRRFRFDVLDILAFKTELLETAQKTTDSNQQPIPGVHCRFCPASGICPALKNKALAIAQNVFEPTTSYNPEKLGETLQKLDQVEAWIEAVRSFAYSEAKQGRIPPGFKLVAKRATRKWIDETQAINTLQNNLRFGGEIYETKLKSVSQMEKLLSKDQKLKISECVIAVSSGDVLVPDSDSRPAIKSLDVHDIFEDETVNQLLN